MGQFWILGLIFVPSNVSGKEMFGFLIYFDSKTTYQVRTNLGTGTKHQFTLSVGIVELTREESGHVICSAHRLIKEALPIAGAKKLNK